MANYVTFIDFDYLTVDNELLDKNVSAKKIEHLIITAQDLHIEPILGTNLFQKMMDDIYNGTITGAYKTLLEDKIMKALAAWVVYESKAELNYQTTNKNVAKKKSDYSDAAELDEIKFIESKSRNIAETYSRRVETYINNNIASFPEHFNYSTLVTVNPIRSNFFGGVYLGRDCDNDCDNLKYVR